MRKCQQCHRARSAQSNTVDLCETCDAAIAEEVQKRARAIKEALRNLKEESSLAAKLRHWDLILAEAEALLKYEEREIATTCPPPSTLLEDFRALRDALRTE
jgi:hypothetical protein